METMERPPVVDELNALCTQLEAIFARHPGAEDTDVRDRVCAVLQSLLLEGDLDTKVPLTFGVFSPGVNLKVRAALNALKQSEAVLNFVNQHDAEARLAILSEAMAQDQIASQSGTAMTEILGEWA